MSWNAILEGVTTGVVGAALLAGYALIHHRLRDAFFRWRLRRDLRLLSVGSSLVGLTVGVRNRAGKPLTVYRVTLVTAGPELRLNATGKVLPSFDERLPHKKPTRKQLRDLKAGTIDKIEIGMEVQWRAAEQPRAIALQDFVDIEPFTSHEFILPYELLMDPNATRVKGIAITLRYEAWPGRYKMLQLVASSSADAINRTIDHAKQQIKSGSMNDARQKFGIPPLITKTDKSPNAE